MFADDPRRPLDPSRCHRFRGGAEATRINGGRVAAAPRPPAEYSAAVPRRRSARVPSDDPRGIRGVAATRPRGRFGSAASPRPRRVPADDSAPRRRRDPPPRTAQKRARHLARPRRYCKHAKERASLLIENVAFHRPSGPDSDVVKELKADLGALLAASSVKQDEDPPEGDDPERVDWWRDFLNARTMQWGQRYAVNQQCKLILEAIATGAEGDPEEEDQE